MFRPLTHILNDLIDLDGFSTLDAYPLFLKYNNGIRTYFINSDNLHNIDEYSKDIHKFICDYKISKFDLTIYSQPVAMDKLVGALIDTSMELLGNLVEYPPNYISADVMIYRHCKTLFYHSTKRKRNLIVIDRKYVNEAEDILAETLSSTHEYRNTYYLFSEYFSNNTKNKLFEKEIMVTNNIEIPIYGCENNEQFIEFINNYC